MGSVGVTVVARVPCPPCLVSLWRDAGGMGWEMGSRLRENDGASVQRWWAISPAPTAQSNTLGRSSKPLRRAALQLWEIMANSSLSASMRVRMLKS